MDFLLTFLEGFASFISPCMLPMIPLFLSYFAGEDEAEETNDDETSLVMDGEAQLDAADESSISAAKNKKMGGYADVI